MNCGKCHKCGHDIIMVLDGEEYCLACNRYQRPMAHGWSSAYKDKSSCPCCGGPLKLVKNPKHPEAEGHRCPICGWGRACSLIDTPMSKGKGSAR